MPLNSGRGSHTVGVRANAARAAGNSGSRPGSSSRSPAAAAAGVTCCSERQRPLHCNAAARCLHDNSAWAGTNLGVGSSGRKLDVLRPPLVEENQYFSSTPLTPALMSSRDSVFGPWAVVSGWLFALNVCWGQREGTHSKLYLEHKGGKTH